MEYFSRGYRCLWKPDEKPYSINRTRRHREVYCVHIYISISVLFTKKSRLIENIPQDALKQHILRAAYQGNVWEQMFENVQQLADPEQCGWKYINGEYLPGCSILPEDAKALAILTSCGYKLGCKGCKPNVCKCIKAGLNCTQLYFCAAKCKKWIIIQWIK